MPLPSLIRTATLLVGGLLVACPGPPAPRKPPGPPPGSMAALTAQLHSPDPDQRTDALRQLGASRKEVAVAALRRGLSDTAAQVRLAAVRACAAHRSPRLVPHLRQRMRDSERTVRHAALQALVGYGHPRADNALVAGLKGAPDAMRHAVATALTAMSPKRLARVKGAVKVLVEALAPTPPKPRLHRLARALRHLGDPALVALLRFMRRTPPAQASELARPGSQCKRAACRALVAMGPAVVPALLRVAKAGIQGIRAKTLYFELLQPVIRKLGPAALPPVVRLFEARGVVCEFARRAMQHADPSTVPHLLRLFPRRRMSVETTAFVMAILSDLRHPRVVPTLLRIARQKHPNLRWIATFLLAKRPTSATAKLLAERLRTPLKERAIRLVHWLGGAKTALAVTLLRAALRRKEPEILGAVAEALASQRDKPSVPALLKLLRRRDAKLRQAVLGALGNLGDPRARPAALRLARRGPVPTRIAAITALSRLQGKRAMALLKRLSRARNQAIAGAAQSALSRVGGPLPKSVIGIRSCDEYVRIYRCYLAKLPAAAKGPAEAAFDKMLKAWKTAAKGPAKASIGRACAMAVQAFAKAFAGNPMTRGCFKPRTP